MTHPYKPNWDSLQAYTVPAWFRDAKLGIFVHWGPYAVPAFGNEWYPRWMYRDEPANSGVNFFRHHVETWGHPSTFGYKDFIPLFKGEQWNPDAWLDLFVEAGARYIVPVAEHHDGFAMYDTPLSRWNALNMGPRRDVITELARAARARNLRFGVSSHRAFNWRYYTYRDDFDTTRPDYADLYCAPHPEDAPADEAFLAHWLAKTKELIDRFEPDVLWFDFGWHFDEFEPYRPEVLAYYYNRAHAWGKEVVLQYKDKLPDGVAVLDIERGKLPGIHEASWQTDTAVSERSWGYIEHDTFKSATTLIHDLVDIVSKNGNLLLNVGPRPDGTLPDAVTQHLRELGAWLAINGEAIYGTRPWHVYGEGPTEVGSGHFSESRNAPLTPHDIRYTTREGALYAIVPGWPGNTVTLTALAAEAAHAAPIETVRLLGSDAAIPWRQTCDGLVLEVPDQRPSGHALVFCIQGPRAHGPY